MRFEAKPWPDAPYPKDSEDADSNTFWFVAAGDIPRFSRRMSKAEAHIIAFALNAVAEGKCLSTPWPPTEDDGMYRYGGMYNGPTTGIAP